MPLGVGIGGGFSEPPLHLCHRRTGFTLVEVLCSSVIIAISFLALVTVFGAGRVSQTKAYYVVRGASAAANKQDTCRGSGYDAISGTISEEMPDLPAGNVRYMAVTSYDQVANSASLKMVTVTMTWAGGAKTPYEAGFISYQTLISARSTESAYKTKRGY